MISMTAAAFSQTTPDKPHSHSGTNALQLTPAFISKLANEMETNNPAILAGLARTNAAAASVSAVRSWEDPIARGGGMGAREDLRASDGDLIYGVEQKLPLFGKPAAARRVALAGLATETATSVYQLQVFRRELAKAAFRTGLADEVILLGEQDLTWLEAVSQASETKYTSGQATLVEARALGRVDRRSLVVALLAVGERRRAPQALRRRADSRVGIDHGDLLLDRESSDDRFGSPK